MGALTPEERVRLFLDAMNEWERRVFPRAVGATDAQMKGWVAELRAIFDAHLTEKGKGPKNWGKKIHPTKDVFTSVSDQQYDQAIVRVEPVPKRKAKFYVFTTARRDANTAYRFTVVVDEHGVPLVEEQRWCVVVNGTPTGDWKSGLH